MRKFVLFCFTLFLLYSCKEEDGIKIGKGNIVVNAGTNYEVDKITTRANEYDEYRVDIAGPQVLTDQRLGAAGAEGFEVVSGKYTVTVTSISLTDYENFVPAFDAPVYQGKAEVSVTSGESAKAEITCTQINAGICLVYDQSVKDFFTDNFTVKLEDETLSKSITFGGGDSEKTAFFKPATLKMTLTNAGSPIKIGGSDYKEFEVKAKEIWTITLKTAQSKPGSIGVDVSIDKTGVDDSEKPEFGIGDTTGDGTVANPYSVSDAINTMPAQNVWVQGYVVGAVTRSANAIVIASKAEEAEKNECILVNIPDGSTLAQLLTVNEGTVVKLKGDVAGVSDESALANMNNLTDFNFEGRNIGPNDGNSITISGKALKDASMPVRAFVRYSDLPADADFLNLIKRDFGSIAADFEIVMNSTEAGNNSTKISTVSDFATTQNLGMYGRALIKASETPIGFPSQTAAAKAAMNSHITNTIGAVSNAQFWDVVTEAYNEDGSIKESYWLSKFGSDYIKYVFEFARAAAPASKLFYEESGLVGNPAKLTAVIGAMKALNADGTTLVDGISVRLDLTAGTSKEDIAAVINAIKEAGFIVHISSLIVSGDDEALQAQTYKDVFDVMKEVPSEQNWGITLGGVSDKYSGGNGLLFDADNNAKQAYFDIINSFE